MRSRIFCSWSLNRSRSILNFALVDAENNVTIDASKAVVNIILNDSIRQRQVIYSIDLLSKADGVKVNVRTDSEKSSRSFTRNLSAVNENNTYDNDNSDTHELTYTNLIATSKLTAKTKYSVMLL